MKTSRACSGMLSHENNAFKFSKTAKNTNSTGITCNIDFRARETVLFLQNSPPLTKNTDNVKLGVELHYIFSKISKFGYWYLFFDAEYRIGCHADSIQNKEYTYIIVLYA